MSYQSLANELKMNNPSMIARWVMNFREKGIEGLKPKKRGRPSKMSKSPKKAKILDELHDGHDILGRIDGVGEVYLKSSVVKVLK